MNSQASSPNASLYGLVDWLLLSGISMEVGEISAYEALQKRQADRQPITEPVIEAAKSPVTAKKPLQQNHIIPEFNSIEELNKFCLEWKDFNLAKTASRCVLGSGNTTPLLYVVTDMPEDEEDRTGEAFTSQTNHIIRKALSFTTIPADEIYFSYLSKWRTPGKRSLASYEMEVCRNLMLQEIRLLKPGFVLTLGESTRELVLNGDGVNELGKLAYGKIYKKQLFNSKMSILSSQKSEFLLKNPAMKKNFWMGLLELAGLISVNGGSR